MQIGSDKGKLREVEGYVKTREGGSKKHDFHTERILWQFLPHFPRENEIYMRHIQLFRMKIYFEGLGIIYVKYILANISQKIYAKYILIIQLLKKIYFVYFDIYVTYIFFHTG